MTSLSVPTRVTAGPRRRARRGLPPPTVLLSGAVLLLIVVVVIAPSLFTGHRPDATDPVHALQGPSGAHLFGTDQTGRDLFARVLYGARPSLLLGLGSTALALVGGTVLGLTAALGGQVVNQVLMRVTDILLALPDLLLALLVIAVLGSGTGNIMVAIGLAFVPVYGRMVRAEAMVVRNSGYVEAARGLGLRGRELMLRHILPNTLAPLLTLAVIGFGTALIAAAGLSFLGLGPQPPSPEWGAMLAAGRDFLQTAWWLGLFPGLAITSTVICVNVVGSHARDRFTRRSAR